MGKFTWVIALQRVFIYTLSTSLCPQTKDLHTFRVKEEAEELMVERLMFKYLDLNCMEGKTKDRKYKYLEQFYSDCRTLLHNVFICYGGRSDGRDIIGMKYAEFSVL